LLGNKLRVLCTCSISIIPPATKKNKINKIKKQNSRYYIHRIENIQNTWHANNGYISACKNFEEQRKVADFLAGMIKKKLPSPLNCERKATKSKHKIHANLERACRQDSCSVIQQLLHDIKRDATVGSKGSSIIQVHTMRLAIPTPAEISYQCTCITQRNQHPMRKKKEKETQLHVLTRRNIQNTKL
jgi:hypothetical protein